MQFANPKPRERERVAYNGRVCGTPYSTRLYRKHNFRQFTNTAERDPAV